jgi:hypothetical protein
MAEELAHYLIAATAREERGIEIIFRGYGRETNLKNFSHPPMRAPLHGIVISSP